MLTEHAPSEVGRVRARKLHSQTHHDNDVDYGQNSPVEVDKARPKTHLGRPGDTRTEKDRIGDLSSLLH